MVPGFDANWPRPRAAALYPTQKFANFVIAACALLFGIAPRRFLIIGACSA